VNIQTSNFQKIQNQFGIRNYYSNFLKLHITILQVYFSDVYDLERRLFFLFKKHNLIYNIVKYLIHVIKRKRIQQRARAFNKE